MAEISFECGQKESENEDSSSKSIKENEVVELNSNDDKQTNSSIENVIEKKHFEEVQTMILDGEYQPNFNQLSKDYLRKKIRFVVVLSELDKNLCDGDDLPEGWGKHIHDSGMPIYVNAEMKVCSFTKPYFLGSKSLKNHDVPVANIPCLAYKIKLQQMNAEKNGEPFECPVKLSHEEYQKYCSKRFKFKHITFMRFKSWDKRRQYIRMVKAARKRNDLPKLKDKAHLMTFPIQKPATNKNTPNPEDQWTINLSNKSYVSILHEYVQQVLKTQPSYEFKELENARFPYLATVILDGIQYGMGIGSSKKQAKLDSARATLEILLPSVKNQIPVNRRHLMCERPSTNNFEGESIFDKLKIKDSRITEFCYQAAESMPYDMLQICVKRNFGEDVNVQCVMESMQSGSDAAVFYRCTMAVNEHTATVICKNKREGRQKGAQALLKVLHPHINYFGSLLRLYSHQNLDSCSEKKINEPGDQSPKPRGGPNYEILQQLREEMTKLESK